MPGKSKLTSQCTYRWQCRFRGKHLERQLQGYTNKEEKFSGKLMAVNIAFTQGCSGVGTRGNGVPHLFLLDYSKTRLRFHRCVSHMQIRIASQKSTLKQEDPVWKHCRRMLTLFELFGAVFLFIWCGNGVHLFFYHYTPGRLAWCGGAGTRGNVLI